jgi:hypothetical protein
MEVPMEFLEETPSGSLLCWPVETLVRKYPIRAPSSVLIHTPYSHLQHSHDLLLVWLEVRFYQAFPKMPSTDRICKLMAAFGEFQG